jgi:hypothetical protein
VIGDVGRVSVFSIAVGNERSDAMLSRYVPLFLMVAVLAAFTSQPAVAQEGTHEGTVVKAGGGMLTTAGNSSIRLVALPRRL